MHAALIMPFRGENVTEFPVPLPRRDRRKYQRVPLRLGGRFLLDGADHPLMSVDLSCGGARFRAKTLPREDVEIVCYIDEIGRICGRVVRVDAESFAITFSATDRKRDKLADQLTWLLNKGRYQLSEHRAAPRYAGGTEATVIRANGQKLTCRVLDLSVTGAAFEFSGPAPFIGERVRAGRLHGVVVRVEPGSFAIRIVKAQTDAV